MVCRLVCGFGSVYIQVYVQVYLHIYIHIYFQVAHNFDNVYAAKLKFVMIFTQTKTLDFMVELPLRLAPGRGQGSECITGHMEHMQNGNRIGSLVPLLALEREIGYNDHRWNSLYRDHGLETGSC